MEVLLAQRGLKVLRAKSLSFSCLRYNRSISEDSLRRYVLHASENCIQELLSASDSNRAGSISMSEDSWKIVGVENGVEISKRRSGSLHTFRSRWVLKSVSPQQFITVANAIDAAKVKTTLVTKLE